MRSVARLAAVLLALSIVMGVMGVMGVTPAAAQEPAVDAIAASLKRFDEGRAAFDAHRFDEARAAFEASYGLQASPNSLLYMGRCYRETGKVASAYVTLKRSAREAQERLNVTLEKRYAATRDAATSEAAAIEPRVPRVVIAVPGGLPRDFAVTRNGEPMTSASWGLALETDPGPIVIDARGARMRPFHAELVVKEGEQRRIDVVVDHLPTAQLSLRLQTRPAGMTIEVDGVSIDPRDYIERRDLEVGPHHVTARANGYLPFRWDRALANRDTADVDIALSPDPNARRRGGTRPWLFFAAAGSAVAATGVATGFAISAASLDADESAKNPLLRDPDARDTIRSRSTIANVLFISGAVLGASATVLLFTTDWRSNAHVGVGPSGLTAEGTF